MNIHKDFKANGKRTKRGMRTYPETAARAETATLLAALGPAIKPLPTTAEWHWDEHGLITF
jgi:hypothetical protein